jgi:phospholipid transport system substrate-binding protein
MFKLLFVSAALAAMTPVASAASNTSSPAELLVSDAASQISHAERERIADSVLEHMDVNAIARFTLGRHGRAMSETDKARFASAFENFLRRQIEMNASEFIGVQIKVTKTVERNARDAVVTTQVEGNGSPITLRWRVIERAGKWSVVDLEFAGLWLAIEQRAQVSAILDRPGADIEDVIATFG